MKLPGGREATLAYLEELNKASEAHGVFKGFERFDEKDNGLPALPIGTRVALVRQMMLIDQTGRIVPSPIVQTVRLRVYLPESRREQNKDAKQEVHKFKITRSALLGGKAGGMKPIGLAEMERLALTHTREELRGTHVELHRCASCHGWLSHNKRIGSVFSFNQGFLSSKQNINLGQKSYPFSFENRARLYPIKIDDELNRTVQWKKSRNDWSMLRGTMDTLLKEE
jgi:hypothetical protein